MPGGLYCCVHGCRSNTKYDNKSFFRLPNELEMLEIWLPLIKREDLLEKSKNGKLNQRICCDHFSEEHFSCVKTINKDAVPCFRLPTSDVNGKPQAYSSSSKTDSLNTESEIEQQNTSDAGTAKVPTMRSYLRQRRKRKFAAISDEINKTIKQEKEETVTTEPSMAKKTFLEWCDQFLNEDMSNIVKCHASLIDTYKGKQYTMDFKLFSLQIYYCKPHAYRYLHQIFNLPSIRMLQMMHVPVSTGVNEHFLKALKYKTLEMTEQEKLCTICIGAMSLKPHLCYEVSTDKVHGLHELDNVVTSIPAEYAVVIMVRGIFHKWEQPIGYALTAECKQYSELSLWIDKCIHNLLKIGLDIRAVVTDLGTDFFNASKAKNISAEKPWFEMNGKKIYCLFDVPNLTKYARNNLMDYEFHFGAKVAKWQHIEQAYDRDSANDLKLMHKLTEKHVKPNDFDKNQIKLATQVFSRTVAAAMNVYVAAKMIDNEAKDTVELICLFNNLFDMLNSTSILDDYVYKRAYQGTDEQKQFLVEAIQFFKRLNLKHPNNSLMGINFIRGFIVTIKSVMSLFEDLKLEGYKFLLTRNINLECLENFFAQIRKRCGNCTEPTAMKFNRAFRRLSSLNVMKPTKQSSCNDDLKSVLGKVSDYIKVSNEASREDVSETPMQASLTTDDTDYKLEWPQGNGYMYITGYLLRKCLEKHSCQKTVDYFNGSDRTKETLYIYVNAGSGVIATSHHFMKFIQNLEKTLQEYFMRNKNNMSQTLGNSLLAKMRQISFVMPCECFPLDFLKKLFIRVRIFAIIKENNNMIKINRKNKNYISISSL